jgi:hypothetical protein
MALRRILPLEGTCSPEHKFQIRYLCEMCIPGGQSQPFGFILSQS